MKSTQAPLCQSSKAYNVQPLMLTPSLEATPMLDHLAHLQMHPMDHAQPPRPYSRPRRPSVHMMAYLITHMCLTDRQCQVPWHCQTHGSSPLVAHTCSHISSVGLQSLLSV